FWDDRLMKRFARAMPDVIDRVHWFPRMEYQQYLALTALCDVMLVPVQFGSGRTSFDAVAMGVPCVTMTSPLMRVRMTRGLAKLLGVDDCTVNTQAEYVERAVRLGTDADYRRQIGEKILAGSSSLFDRDTAVREIEQVIESLCARVT